MPINFGVGSMPDFVVAEPDDRVQETQFSLQQDGVNPDPSHITTTSDAEVARETSTIAPQHYGSTAAPHAETASPHSARAVSVTTSGRALAPDLLRGLLMVFQSLDHAALFFFAWRHGLAVESESDGQVVDEWNTWPGWIARSLTHLCAPGFMFLMGLGIVYFGASRTNLKWSTAKLANHYLLRGLALALVNEILGLVIGRGQFIIINIVLLALAINYTLVGFLYLAFNTSERLLGTALAKILPSASGELDESTRPLLNDSLAFHRRDNTALANNLSWHIHNAIYLVLAAVTIWWNMWMSLDHGHCQADTGIYSDKDMPGMVDRVTLLQFLFYVTTSKLVISPFPPMAWLSPVILGVLYGRIALSRPFHNRTITLANVTAGLFLALLFVGTRLLHFGNLSEGCLRMPEQIAHPDTNQYLLNFRSFLYTIKYPPDLSFMTYSLSLNFFLLALFGAIPNWIAKRMSVLLTFGTSALFFYVVHLILYGVLSALVNNWFGHELDVTDPFRNKPAYGVGNSWAFWITWVLGLAILYPLCGWYGRFKRSKGRDSLWRFF